MKHIFLNLKRFEIPPCFGGVNRLCDVREWGPYIVSMTQEALKAYSPEEVEFVQFFPEAHIIGALSARSEGSPVKIGCQSIYRKTTAIGGNFGAFTGDRPASAMKVLGVSSTIVGHCEERTDKAEIMSASGVPADFKAINVLLNQEIKTAIDAGMKVLYCIGEKSEEQERWEEVLGEQLEIGLAGVDKSKVVIGYEPIWSIGPGKTPADKKYITKIARFVKETADGIDIVYGGGLKLSNSEMLASIPEIDGGLIALTRFSGNIGFYPDEYIQIIHNYLGK